MTGRDDLAAIIRQATDDGASRTEDYADAIIAAGWTAPATTKPDFAVGPATLNPELKVPAPRKDSRQVGDEA